MNSNPVYTFLKSLDWQNLPSDVQNRTRHLLLDLLGTAIAGTGTKLHGSVSRYVQRNLRGPRARILFSGSRASPEGAALVGGMTIDAVDAHDGQKLTKGHVGCALLPALLAALDDTKAEVSGEAFLALLAAGYEIGTRCGVALHATVPDYHTSGAWNAVNCAAIASHLLGLSRDQFDHALGIAEYHGPRSQMMRVIDHPTMLKDGSGWGALAGVSAAYLAGEGFTGAPAITVLSPDVQELWSTLGRDWELMNQYVKGFPVCRWGQPSVQAVLDLLSTRSLELEEVVGVEIATFHQGTRLFKGVPENTEQAQYAIAFPVAAAIARGKVGLPEISEAAFEDPELIRLTQSAVFLEDDTFNARFPAERWARATLKLKSGETLVSAPAQARGDPETPFTEREIIEKFFLIAGDVCREDKLTGIKEAVFGLDETKASLVHLQKAVFQTL